MYRLIENQMHLADWAKAQRGKIDIAVAFWGKGAIELLGLSAKRDFRILLDLNAGGTNPAEVQLLLNIDPTAVRCLDRLHAKAFIGRNEVVVGSANASANGLGAEGTEATRWHELGIITDDALIRKNTKKWFERKWRAAQPISTAMLKEAEAAWEKNRKNRHFTTQNTNRIPLLDAVAANPADFEDRRIFVTVTTQNVSRKAAAQIRAIERETGHPVHVFEDWPSMPANAQLISICNWKDDEFEIDGVYFTGETKQRGWLKYVTPSEISGCRIGPVSRWHRLLMKAKKDSTVWDDADGMHLDIVEFFRRFAQSSPK